MTTTSTIHKQVMTLVNDVNFRKAVRDVMVMIGMTSKEWNDNRASIIYRQALNRI